MKEKKVKCETCHLRGYNTEYCKWHRKAISEIETKDCYPGNLYKKLGKTAAIGAGIGIVSATAGVAAAPILGLKALIGHALAAKVTAGGGCAVLAGANVLRKTEKEAHLNKKTKGKKVLLPLYL